MQTEHTDDLPSSQPIRASRWRIAAIGLAVLALGSLGVGVASAQEDDSTDAPEAPAEEGDEAPPTEEEREARTEAFRACLADQGIDVPEEGEERPDPSELTEEQREAFQAAREACAEFAPPHRPGCGPGGPGGPGRPGGEEGEAPADAPAEEGAS